jgi:IclR family pca regulon transcriptional regulator
MESALAAPGGAAGPGPGGGATTGAGSALRTEDRPAPGTGDGPAHLQSLARGLAVLDALGDDQGAGLTLTAVAEATGLARATARRALLTLEQLGYAGHPAGDHRGFRLRPKVLELGYALLSERSFDELVQPHLAELVVRVGESASMAVLDGPEILYVARVPTTRIMSVSITLGTRFPAYATAMGRVLLGGLDPADLRSHLPVTAPEPLTRHTVTSPDTLARIVVETAGQGYALVEEELEDGLRSLAVPVRDAHGHVRAALNLAQHTGRGTREQMLTTLLPALRETAARIEADVRVGGAGW